MAVTDEEIAFVTDLFSGVGQLSTRKMFGGLSIYSEGRIFAIIGPDDQIFIKARDDLAGALAAESRRAPVTTISSSDCSCSAMAGASRCSFGSLADFNRSNARCV